MTGKNRNAFCAVRPPGHHAGPRGLVTCGNDMHGSHGFCLLNNVVSFACVFFTVRVTMCGERMRDAGKMTRSMKKGWPEFFFFFSRPGLLVWVCFPPQGGEFVVSTMCGERMNSVGVIWQDLWPLSLLAHTPHTPGRLSDVQGLSHGRLSQPQLTQHLR